MGNVVVVCLLLCLALQEIPIQLEVQKPGKGIDPEPASLECLAGWGCPAF